MKHLQAENGIFDAGALPDSITHLRVGQSSDSPKFQLPSSLTHLGADDVDIFDTVDRTFPASLSHLVLNGGVHPQIPPIEPGDIPSTVTYLSLARQARPGAIPNSVTHLELDQYLDSPLQIGVIPDSVTTLSFGDEFHGQLLLPGVIPSSVTTLNLGEYNRPLQQNVIPNSVTSLTFGGSFDHLIFPGVIPHSVKKLEFHDPFNQPLLSFPLPMNILNAVHSQCSVSCPTHCLLSNVTLRSIPDSVVELTCSWPADEVVPVGVIPSSVKKLSLGRPNCFATSRWRKSCDCTDFILLPGSIPSSVTHLDMGCFNQPIGPGIIPSSVQYLKFGKFFLQQHLPPEWSGNPNLYLYDDDPVEFSLLNSTKCCCEDV